MTARRSRSGNAPTKRRRGQAIGPFRLSISSLGRAYWDATLVRLRRLPKVFGRITPPPSGRLILVKAANSFSRNRSPAATDLDHLKTGNTGLGVQFLNVFQRIVKEWTRVSLAP